MPVSHRRFVATTALTAGSTLLPGSVALAGNGPLTVSDVLSRIRQHVGVPWTTPTVDNLLSGKPDMPVKGIATTMMATLDVCKRAHNAGCNLVITHETPFYLHQDKTDDLRGNPVFLAKQAWLAQKGVALFHFHDFLHRMQPDGVARGMVDQLAWSGFVTDPDLKHLDFKGMPLQQIAVQLATKLEADTIRVVGDPELRIHAARTSWGYCSREGGIAILTDPAIELLLCGETREWELVEYVQDAITAGQRKSLIVVGHVLSEQGGARFAASWLRNFIHEVPVQFISAPEPFWRPDKPRERSS